MRSVNRVTLLGQLKELEMRKDSQKPVCNFEVETIEEFVRPEGPQRRSTIHTCVAFGLVAASIGACRVGDYIYVEGAARPDRDAPTNHAFEVVCFVAIPVAEPVIEEVS